MLYASQLDTNRTDYSGINKLWASWVYVGRRCLVEAAAHGCNSQPSWLREETLFSGSFLLYCKIAKLWFLEVGGCQHSKGTQANWAPWTSPGLSASRHGPCCPWALVPYPTRAQLERLCATTATTHPTDRKPVLRTWHSSDRRLVLQGLGIWEAVHFSLYRYML